MHYSTVVGCPRNGRILVNARGIDSGVGLRELPIRRLDALIGVHIPAQGTKTLLPPEWQAHQSA